MFRRLEKSLPLDPGKDFAGKKSFYDLGYFVNKHQQIRSKSNPEQRFIYRISNNERYNEVHRDAMNRTSRSFFQFLELTMPPRLHSRRSR
jgi:hypothetical protein